MPSARNADIKCKACHAVTSGSLRRHAHSVGYLYEYGALEAIMAKLNDM